MQELLGLSQAHQLAAMPKNTTLDAGREAPPPAGLVVPLQHPLLTKSKTEPGVKGEMF